MKPPEPLRWKQRDAMTLYCPECGDVVQAVCADLHDCVREEQQREGAR